MKKVQILALAAFMLFSSLGAETGYGLDDIDLDQLIKDVKEKLEKRRQERGKTGESRENGDLEEIDVESSEREDLTENGNDESAQIAPKAKRGQRTLTRGTVRGRGRVQRVAKADYPEASFPKEAPSSFRPPRNRAHKGQVAEKEVSFPKSYKPALKRHKKQEQPKLAAKSGGKNFFSSSRLRVKQSRA